MFSDVSHEVVKSVGKGILFAIPSLEVSSKIKMLNVVMKEKRSFIIWKKTNYIPYDVPLEDILEKKGLEIKEDKKPVCELNTETNNTLRAQCGADIMDGYMDFKLMGSGSKTFKSDLHKITKDYIEPIQLLNKLENRNLSMKHPFVRQICNKKMEKKVMCTTVRQICKKKKVMCVVTEVLSLANDATISRVDDVNAEADVNTNILNGALEVNFHKGKVMRLPKGTPLAYTVVELKVNTNSGSIEPIIEVGKSGGFDIEVGKDEADGTEGAGSDIISSILQPILDLDPDTRNEIKSIILRMMEIPSDIYVMAYMINIFEDDEDLSAGSERKAFMKNISSLEKNLTSDKDLWMRLFEIMGLNLKTEKEPPIPESSISLLNAFGYIFDALTEISADDLAILRSVSDEVRKGLLQLCKFTMNGKSVMELDGETKSVMQDVNGRKLAERIGYKFKETNVTIANGPEKPSPELEQVYWVLYALHG